MLTQREGSTVRARNVEDQFELLEGGKNGKNGYGDDLLLDSVLDDGSDGAASGTLSIRDKRAISLLIALCKR